MQTLTEQAHRPHGLTTGLILCLTLLCSAVQAQPRFNDPRVVAERMQVAGVSRCISLLVVWSAGLVKAPNIRADGPEIRSNNALMEVYGNARRHLIASSGNPAMSGAIDGMVRQQGEYFGNIVRFQGWDAIIPEYRQCADAAQVASAAPQAPARAAAQAAPAPAVSAPASPSVATATASPGKGSEAEGRATTSSKSECDELAGSPFDPEKVSAGVTWDNLNAVPAVRACKSAVTETPRSGRAWFQYGRSLEKANQLPQAIDAYRRASELNHAAAHNNLGELYRDGKGVSRDIARAEDLFAQSAKLGSSEGAANLQALRKKFRH